MRADAFTLDREKRRRLLPRRLDHHTRRLAGPVCFTFCDEIDPVVIVSCPGRVSGADRIERQARRREILRVPRHGADHKRSSRRERNRERNRIGRCCDREVARFDFLPFAFPRVEPIALGAADTVPLLFHEREIDVDAGDRLAVRRDRNDCRGQAALLVHEQRRTLQADVPRCGMHDEARTSRNVLARDVFDVGLERVLIRQAVARLRLEVQCKLTFRIERCDFPRQSPALGPHSLFAAADEDKSIVRVPIDDDCRRRKCGGP